MRPSKNSFGLPAVLLAFLTPFQSGAEGRLGIAESRAGMGLAASPSVFAQTSEEKTYLAEIKEYRRQRDHKFRTSPFSQLALIHRLYLKDAPRRTIGSGPEADLLLADSAIAPLHAVIEGASPTPALRALENAVIWTLEEPRRRLTELTLKDGTGVRLGPFNLRYILHPSWGRTLEVYDPRHPQLVGFKGFDYFAADPAYRVAAEVLPSPNPERLALPDSQGNQRPVWLYGELRFQLQGTPCRLELYSSSLDPEEIKKEGFMLIFTDATSGRESYPAARYLDIEGQTAGPVTVDFNKAYTPPCDYSPVFTCPFPRPQNRLPVAVRAGQKRFRQPVGKPATEE